MKIMILKKNYLLIEKEGEVIGVITNSANIHNFYLKVRMAISEHFVCDSPDDVSLDIFNEIDDIQENIEASLIIDGEDKIRNFNLSEIPIY